MKDLAEREKAQVGLEERRKHAKTKLKKLNKAITDVSKRRYKMYIALLTKNIG